MSCSSYSADTLPIWVYFCEIERWFAWLELEIFYRYLKLDALVRVTVRNWKHSYFPTSKCRICLMRPFLFSHRYSSIIWFHEGQSPKMSIEFEYSLRRSSLELFNFSSIIYIYIIQTYSFLRMTYVRAFSSFFFSDCLVLPSFLLKYFSLFTLSFSPYRFIVSLLLPTGCLQGSF